MINRSLQSSRVNHLKALVLLAMSSAVLAACGGGNGSDETSSASAPLSKPAFIKEANSICRKGLAEKESLLRAGILKLEGNGKSPSKGEVENLAREILPPYQQMAEQLEGIKPPSEDRAKVAQIVKQLSAALREAEENPARLVEGNPFLAAHRRAVAYGLRSCEF